MLRKTLLALGLVVLFAMAGSTAAMAQGRVTVEEYSRRVERVYYAWQDGWKLVGVDDHSASGSGCDDPPGG